MAVLWGPPIMSPIRLVGFFHPNGLSTKATSHDVKLSIVVKLDWHWRNPEQSIWYFDVKRSCLSTRTTLWWTAGGISATRSQVTRSHIGTTSTTGRWRSWWWLMKSMVMMMRVVLKFGTRPLCYNWKGWSHGSWRPVKSRKKIPSIFVDAKFSEIARGFRKCKS